MESEMTKNEREWQSILPGGLSPSKFTLDELRNAKQVHAFLTEPIPGPEGIVYLIRGFRYLLFFGIACIAENKYPALTRCWDHLKKVFLDDPTFDDHWFVQSWILMDFPFGPDRQTGLDYFEEFLKGTEMAPRFQPFIHESRRSRLGLYQDILRTKKVAKFRELISGRVIEAFPSINDYGQGEILLVRTMEYEGQVFLFGNAKGFPREARREIEEMVTNKLFYFDEGNDEAAQYETFMKLAGPYWMSCITKNEDVPIFSPDHYQTYLKDGARG
jgi:hypothetical protein